MKSSGFHEIWRISCEKHDIAFPQHSMKLKSYKVCRWISHEIRRISWNPQDFQRPIARNGKPYVFPVVLTEAGSDWVHLETLKESSERHFPIRIGITPLRNDHIGIPFPVIFVDGLLLSPLMCVLPSSTFAKNTWSWCSATSFKNVQIFLKKSDNCADVSKTINFNAPLI